MAGSALIDTNVLVYRTGLDGPQKATIAATVLDDLTARRAGSLSTQILSEYASVMLRRAARPDRPQVSEAVAMLRRAWPVLTVTGETVDEAIRGTVQHGMSYYDAQIWATARLAGIEMVLTEDFTDGAEVEGVRFVNPFAPGFDPRDVVG